MPRQHPKSDILKNLIEAQGNLKDDDLSSTSDVVEGDYIHDSVRCYEIEIAAGLKLISEYEALKPILSKSFSDKRQVYG